MTEGQTRIGFVDDNLENFHSNVYLKLLRNELKHRGFVVAGCTGLRPRAGRKWAEVNGVPWFSDAAGLNEAVDCFMVLAPSTPETHVELCQQVFPFGKPTYVDKTFAPDLHTARRIFALADTNRVPMQTTSALRYTEAQVYVEEVGRRQVRHMVTWGGGRSFGEYAIHPLELAVSCMGPGVQRVMRRGAGKQSQLLLDYTGGRTAVVNVYTGSSTPFAATVTTTTATRHFQVDSGRIFLNTADAILDLFESGKPAIDRKESLIIRRILDVAGQKRALSRFVNL